MTTRTQRDRHTRNDTRSMTYTHKNTHDDTYEYTHNDTQTQIFCVGLYVSVI